jgi:hypothetical protein
MLTTSLCEVQCVTEELPHVGRKRHQVLLGASDPFERFFFVGHASIIRELVYSANAAKSSGKGSS